MWVLLSFVPQKFMRYYITLFYTAHENSVEILQVRELVVSHIPESHLDLTFTVKANYYLFDPLLPITAMINRATGLFMAICIVFFPAGDPC